MEINQLILKAEVTAELGRATATYLQDVLRIHPESSSIIAVVLQERIRLCNQPRNVWIAPNVISRNGDRFNASGRYWQCNSILCSGCQQLLSRRKRIRLRAIFKQIKLRSGESFQFITYTIPKLGISLLQNHQIVNYAFSLLRKRKWHSETIRGSVRKFEFTNSRRGIHFHVHELAVSRYIVWSKMRSDWTDCVQAAALKYLGRTLEIATADKLLNVQALKVHNQDRIVFELCKYVTKSDVWLKLEPVELMEYASADRLPRLWELLGQFKDIDRAVRGAAQLVRAENSQNGAYVHKANLSDSTIAQERETWKTISRKLTPFAAIEMLHRAFDRAISERKPLIDKRYAITTVQTLPQSPHYEHDADKSHRSLIAIYDHLEAIDGEATPF